MFFVQHNSLTSLKTFAKVLQDELSNISNIYNLSELEAFKNKTNKVAIIDGNLKENLEQIMQGISKDNSSVMPKVLIAMGNNIQTEPMSQVQQNSIDRVELVNEVDENDKVFLEGVWFEYFTDIQIILLSKNNYVSKELQLELKRILSKISTVKYTLRVVDDTNPSLLYVCKDYGSIQLTDIANNNFEVQSDLESGYYATFITGRANDAYFKLSDANITLRKSIIGTIT